MQKTIDELRDEILNNLNMDMLQYTGAATNKSFRSKIRTMSNLFKIEDAIMEPNFKLEKTHSICDADLTELCYNISQSEDIVVYFYKCLKHYNYKDAVFLQPHLYLWLQDNSSLLNEDITLLLMVIYKRLFGYDLQAVHKVLQSNKPNVYAITDNSDLMDEGYADEYVSIADVIFRDFIIDMISCFEKNGYVNMNTQEKLLNQLK